MQEGKTAKIVLAHAEEIRDVCQRYPAIAEQIENFQKDIRCYMKEIYHEIKNMEISDQSLVMILIINEIHKLTDEIFL